MKAISIHEYGDVDCLYVDDLPEPQCDDNEVLIDVKSAALNHLDIWVRMGRPGAGLKMPHILGSDAAGVVVEVASRAGRVAPGDEVVLYPGLSCGKCRFCLEGQQTFCLSFGIIGLTRSGTFAERIAVPAMNVYPKPGHLSFTEAAALSLDHLTAWRMLHTRGRLTAGRTVLIHGIGGGLALAALQIARLAGAQVLVTSSSDEKLQRAGQMGAQGLFNYRKASDLPEQIMAFTENQGLDLVFDSVGGAAWPLNEKILRRGGTVVLCGVTGGAEARVNLQAFYWNQYSLLGSTMGSHEDYRQMLRAVNANKIKPVIDSVYPLEQAPAAARRMEAARQFGKIVLEIASTST